MCIGKRLQYISVAGELHLPPELGLVGHENVGSKYEVKVIGGGAEG